MGRMFEVNGKRVCTWNPCTGCLHDCSYCFGRDVALNLQKRGMKKYENCGFKPKFHPNELLRNLGKNKVWFVCDMADLWGEWVTDDIILTVLKKCFEADNSNTFLFLTKNPSRYLEIYNRYPQEVCRWKSNFVFGTSIETNAEFITSKISKAPEPRDRAIAMIDLPKSFRRFISIEPILDFDNRIMVDWILEIKPEFIYIGYDGHGHNLPEPSLEKTNKLIHELRRCGMEVREKSIREAWNEV